MAQPCKQPSEEPWPRGSPERASGCLSPLEGCVRDVQSGSEMLCHRLYRGFGPAVTQACGIRPTLAPWTHRGPLDGSAADPRRTYGPHGCGRPDPRGAGSAGRRTEEPRSN